jgi:hypothetical protein
MHQEKTEEQAPPLPRRTSDVSRFLFNLIVFATGSLVMKLAWNMGLASLFPQKLPHINYMHAVTWLTMLYIVSRVVASAWMGEVERTVTDLLEEFVDTLEEIRDVAESVLNKKKQTDSNPTSDDVN